MENDKRKSKTQFEGSVVSPVTDGQRSEVRGLDPDLDRRKDNDGMSIDGYVGEFVSIP